MTISKRPKKKPVSLRRTFSNFVANGAIQEGIDFFQETVAKHPEHGLAWRFLGRLQESYGENEKAYYAFQQAVLCNQRAANITEKEKTADYIDLIRFCIRQGWTEKAERYIDEGLRGFSTNEALLNLKAHLSKSLSATVQPSKARHQTNKPEKIKQRSVISEQAASSLLIQAQVSIDKGQLDEAESLYKQAIAKNPGHSKPYVILAHTYSRLALPAKAEHILLEALSRQTDNELSVLNTLGTLYMKMGRQKDYIKVYDEVLTKAKFDSTRVGAYQWLGKGYTELGQYDKAIEACKAALELSPGNYYVQTILNKAERLQAKTNDLLVTTNNKPSVITSKDEEHKIHEEDERVEWGEDEEILLKAGTLNVSFLLDADVDRHEWNDPTILTRGGVVKLEDARRLMKDAISAQEKFGARAQRFLEAAKAFRSLDEFEQDPGKYQDALQRYASQQGGYYFIQLISEIRRNPNPRTARSRWLRDAACAYYVEAMKILQLREPKFMFIILQRYLQTLLIYELEVTQAEKLFGNLDARWSLGRILDEAAQHPIQKLLDRVARGLLELGRAQLNLIRRAYDVQEVKEAISKHRERWRDVLESLGSRARQIPAAMRLIVYDWRTAEREAQNKFSEVINFRAGLESLADVRGRLEELLIIDGVFSDSDKEFLREIIDNLLGELSRYGELPSNSVERAVLIEQAQRRIGELRERIREFPTYWGRIRFDALLQKWETLLGKAEQARLAEIRPELFVRLESKRLSNNEANPTLVFSITNNGQATALNTTFHLIMHNAIFNCDDNTVNLGNIAPTSSKSAQVQIRIPETSGQLKFLTVVYKVSYGQDGQEESLPSSEDTIHFGAFRKISENPFNETEKVISDRMFKGREELLSWLAYKLKTNDRVRSTLLYGLSRTGKTSLLFHLQKRIKFSEIHINDKEITHNLLPLLVAFDRCGSCDTSESYFSMVFSIIDEQIEELVKSETQHHNILFELNFEEFPKNIIGFEKVVSTLYKTGYYPVFLIDEFTTYRQMFTKKVLDASFLSRLRHFSIEQKIASFIYSGTYDLKALTNDPAYGFTGQFVATDERQVGRISDEAARELVQVIQDKLYFSDTAIDEILFLSGRIPHFIQLICKNCVYYANEYEKPSITPVELESVVDRLVRREDQADRVSQIQPISAAGFSANLWKASDTPYTTALLAALAFHSRAGSKDIYLSIDQIENVFRNAKVPFDYSELIDTLDDLYNKQIVEVHQTPTNTKEYRISVDLFRRWFVRNQSFEWAIGRLRRESENA